MAMPKGWNAPHKESSVSNYDNENSITCRHCMKKSYTGSVFCVYCGVKFENNTENSLSQTIQESIPGNPNSSGTSISGTDETLDIARESGTYDPDISDEPSSETDPRIRLEFYEKVLLSHPNSHVALNDKGLVLAEMGQYKEALDSYNRALKNHRLDFNIWLNKAKALIALNRDDEAIQCYAKVLEYAEKKISSGTDNMNALVAKAGALMDLQRYDNAVECYDKAIALSPSDDSLWNNKGYALSELKDYDSALTCFNEVIKLNPRDVDAWNNKAHVFESLEKHDKEIECYGKILELEPNNINAWCNKGLVFYESEKFAEALKCYNKAVEITPNDSEVWNRKGLTLICLENYPEGIICFNKALELNPDYVEAIYNIGSTKIKIGLLDEGFLHLEKAIKLGGKEIQDMLKEDEFMEGVREDARFEQLLE